jgi:hypothetical protein
MATSVAAAITLVLSASLPALANHAEPDATLEGNANACADLKDLEGFSGDLDKHSDWNTSTAKNTATPPTAIQHPWWTVSFDDLEGNENAVLNIDLIDGMQVVVLVKGGDATNVFISEPGENMVGLFAPTLENDKHPTISHYTICKVDNGAYTPPDDEETPPDEEETPPPDEGEGEGGGEATPTPTATASKTPVAVPTSVPAGLSGSSAELGAVIVAALAVVILAAGAAVLSRRLTA